MTEAVAQAIDAEVQKHIKAADEKFSARLIELEKEMQEQVKARTDVITGRIAWLFAGLVLFALGGMALSVYGSTRQVNDQVISLQTSMIAAQTTIQQSDKALREQTEKLTAGTNALASTTSQLNDKKEEIARLLDTLERRAARAAVR